MKSMQIRPFYKNNFKYLLETCEIASSQVDHGSTEHETREDGKQSGHTYEQTSRL